MDNPTQALWDAIHRGSALLRPVPVVGARRHSIHHPSDDEEVATYQWVFKEDVCHTRINKT